MVLYYIMLSDICLQVVRVSVMYDNGMIWCDVLWYDNYVMGNHFIWYIICIIWYGMVLYYIMLRDICLQVVRVSVMYDNGMIWCDVLWYDNYVMGNHFIWCGTILTGSGVVWVWFATAVVSFGTIWYGMVWCDVDVTWCDVIWYFMIFSDMIRSTLPYHTLFVRVTTVVYTHMFFILRRIGKNKAWAHHTSTFRFCAVCQFHPTWLPKGHLL